MNNQDEQVIKDFGDEWTQFNFESFDDAKLKENFDQYFEIFPWHLLTKDAVGFDMGCGSGRWAVFSAPRVGFLNCIDPSIKALNVAKDNLSEFKDKYFQRIIVYNLGMEIDQINYLKISFEILCFPAA